MKLTAQYVFTHAVPACSFSDMRSARAIPLLTIRGQAVVPQAGSPDRLEPAGLEPFS